MLINLPARVEGTEGIEQYRHNEIQKKKEGRKERKKKVRKKGKKAGKNEGRKKREDRKGVKQGREPEKELLNAEHNVK